MHSYLNRIVVKAVLNRREPKMGKSKKNKAARLCTACGFRHPTPTGRNCSVVKEKLDTLPGDLPENQHVDDDQSSDEDQGAAAAMHTQQLKEVEFRDELNARLDHLENIIMQSLKKDGQDVKKPDVHKPEIHDVASGAESDFSGFSDDSEDRRHRRKARRAKSRFEQQRFSPDGEAVSSFEMLMLVTANTMTYLLDHDLDVSTLVHHFKFLAAKATAARYIPEAFVNYDSSVRHRVARDGLQAFADVSQEEVVLQFCPENMYPRKPVKKPEQKKKTSNYCRQYNDAECHYQNCIFAHRCLACDEQGHGRRLCPSVKKSK